MLLFKGGIAGMPRIPAKYFKVGYRLAGAFAGLVDFELIIDPADINLNRLNFLL